MVNILGIHGSRVKNGNTHELLKQAEICFQRIIKYSEVNPWKNITSQYLNLTLFQSDKRYISKAVRAVAIGKLSVYLLGRLNFVVRSVLGNLNGTGSAILPRIAKTFSGLKRIKICSPFCLRSIRVSEGTFKIREVTNGR